MPLGEGVPTELGALVEPLAVGYHAARRGNCSADGVVLVIGGGPIGQAVALAAGRLGSGQVFVGEPQANRRQLCSSLGVSVLDPKPAFLDSLVESLAGRLPSRPATHRGPRRRTCGGASPASTSSSPLANPQPPPPPVRRRQPPLPAPPETYEPTYAEHHGRGLGPTR